MVRLPTINDCKSANNRLMRTKLVDLTRRQHVPKCSFQNMLQLFPFRVVKQANATPHFHECCTRHVRMDRMEKQTEGKWLEYETEERQLCFRLNNF
jgi:hypothetical protein